MTFILPTQVSAQPNVCGFYGSVILDGSTVADGTVIKAWIDSAVVLTTDTTSSQYNMAINGEGFVFDDKPVIITVGDLDIQGGIGIYTRGANNYLDINAITPPSTSASAATVTLSNQLAGQTSNYVITFNIGSAGALTADTDDIILTFPTRITLPSSLDYHNVLVSTAGGTAINVGVGGVDVSGQTVTVHCPINISNSGTVTVTITQGEEITSPQQSREPSTGIGDGQGTEGYNISVSTSQEPTPINSNPYYIYNWVEGDLTGAAIGDPVTVTGGGFLAGSTVTLSASGGATGSGTVASNGTINITGTATGLAAPITATDGSERIASTDTSPAGTSVSGVTVALSNQLAGQISNYVITFNVGPSGALTANIDDIILTFPSGTTLPSAMWYQNVLVGTPGGTAVNVGVGGVNVSGRTVIINTPINVSSGTVTITMTQGVGIVNPQLSREPATGAGDGQGISGYSISVYTTQDTAPIDSSPYYIYNWVEGDLSVAAMGDPVTVTGGGFLAGSTVTLAASGGATGSGTVASNGTINITGTATSLAAPITATDDSDRTASTDITPAGTSVSAATVTLSNQLVEQTSRYSIAFNVNSSGALTANIDDIILTFPSGTTLPSSINYRNVFVSTPGGTAVNVGTGGVDVSGRTVIINTPINVSSGTVTITITQSVGIVNPQLSREPVTATGDGQGTDGYSVSVYTSQDTAPIDSNPYYIYNWVEGDLTGAAMGDPVTITGGGFLAGSTVTLSASGGATGSGTVASNGTINITGTATGLAAPITATDDSGRTASTDTIPTGTSLNGAAVTLSNQLAGQVSDYTVAIDVDPSGALTTDYDDIVLTFPSGTTVPVSIDYHNVLVGTPGGTAVNVGFGGVDISGRTVIINTPINVSSGTVTITMTQGVGIVNPQLSREPATGTGDGQGIDGYSVSVYTSQDTAPVDADPYFIYNWIEGDPMAAAMADQVTVTGGGFMDGAAVSLQGASGVIGSGTMASNGTITVIGFATGLALPIIAIDGTGRTASTSSAITILPRVGIVPSAGPSGTAITLTGYDLTGTPTAIQISGTGWPDLPVSWNTLTDIDNDTKIDDIQFQATIPGGLAVGSNQIDLVQTGTGTGTTSFTVTDTEVSLSSASYSVAENDPSGNATITAVLSGTSSLAITANYTTYDGTAIAGSDYTTTSGTLTFAPGSNSETFSIPIINDSNHEPNETVTVTLVALPVNTVMGSPSAATLTIQDDDAGAIYVNSVASGSNNGTSWTHAYTSLQSALDDSGTGDEIWVASGTYTPTTLSGTNARTATFQMENGVAIYGGFDPSVGNDEFAERDWENNVTVLSGDIGTPGDNSDNCYHVFFHPLGTSLDNTAILDGFVITGGCADGSYPHNRGSGMFNYYCDPTIANCTFSSNFGTNYGCMLNTWSSPTITNCIFSYNTSSNDGGGISNINESSPIVTNCYFFRNSIPDEYFSVGGGMYNNGYGSISNPIINNCVFAYNTAGRGGGMDNRNGASPILTGCTFIGNSANTEGGAMYNFEVSPTVTNCILWQNSPDQIAHSSGTPSVTFSDIQGGYYGTGNINTDPLFVNPGSGNFHLQPTSPCIDSGSNPAVPASITTDFEGDDRIIDGDGNRNAIVDMGADESPNPDYVLITIGNLTDMTGVASSALVPEHMALADMVEYFNAQNLIPGVQLEIVTYDGQYDPTRDIPGYEWLKLQGADLIFTPIPHTPETLKSSVEADEVVLFSSTAREEATTPPGWIFAMDAIPSCYSEAILNWIAENDPDFPQDRPARIGGAFWNDSYGPAILDGGEAYANAHPDQYEWVAGCLNYYSFIWDTEVEALKDCDYVFPPVPPNAFITQYRDAGATAKLIGFDAHLAFFGQLIGADLWDEIDGMLFVQPSRWWNEEGQIIDLTKQLLYENHPVEADEIIHVGSGYLTAYQFYLMLEIIKDTVEAVGPDNFDSQALYDAATSFTFSLDSIDDFATFDETKRSIQNYFGIYEADATQQDIFRISPQWQPIHYSEATAPDFSVNQGTTLTDQVFVDADASCSSTASMTLDYSSVDTSTPGDYPYTVTCQTQCCGNDTTQGTVSVVETHTVTFTAGTGGSLTGTTSQTVADGGNCTTVTANAASGYQFNSWTISPWTGAGSYSNLNQSALTITNVTGDISATANFAASAPAGGGGGGPVGGGGAMPLPVPTPAPSPVSTPKPATTPEPPPAPPTPPTPPEEPVLVVAEDLTEVISSEGIVSEVVTVSYPDAGTTLVILAQTEALDAGGQPLEQITVQPVDTSTPEPPDSNMICTLDFGPDDATFDPPISITMTYDPDELPDGVAPENLVLAYYDDDLGEWVELSDITIDPVTHTISGMTSHFTQFAVLAQVIEEQAIEPTPTAEVEPTPIIEDEDDSPMNVGLIVGVLIAVVAILAVSLSMFLRKRNKGKSIAGV